MKKHVLQKSNLGLEALLGVRLLLSVEEVGFFGICFLSVTVSVIQYVSDLLTQVCWFKVLTCRQPSVEKSYLAASKIQIVFDYTVSNLHGYFSLMVFRKKSKKTITESVDPKSQSALS